MEAQYSCKDCAYKTGTKRTLKGHIQRKHEGVFVLCDKCDYKATEMPALN